MFRRIALKRWKALNQLEEQTKLSNSTNWTEADEKKGARVELYSNQFSPTITAREHFILRKTSKQVERIKNCSRVRQEA